jgi:hypothetical protein
MEQCIQVPVIIIIDNDPILRILVKTIDSPRNLRIKDEIKLDEFSRWLVVDRTGLKGNTWPEVMTEVVWLSEEEVNTLIKKYDWGEGSQHPLEWDKDIKAS